MILNSTSLLRHASLLAMAFALSVQSWGQVDRSRAPEAGPAPELKIGASTKLELENGLQVIVVENHRMPAVSWSMTLDYPPFLEGERAGLLDVASEMMASGTETRTKAQIAEDVEFLGARFSASAKGFFASSLKKHSGDLLRIVADAFLHPTFPEEELTKVKTQLSSGLANTATSPGSIASNMVARVNFGDLHPYGEVMTEASLERISRDDLVEYHNTFVRPNAAYLIVVGDITPDQAYAKANSHFGKWSRGNIPFTRITPARMPNGNQVRFAALPGAVQSTINITQPVPLPYGHPDGAAIELMNSILGGGAFSGRLMQNLREDKAFTYGARSSMSPDPISSSFVAYADVRSEVTDSAIVEFLYEINRIRETEVDSTDLATAKAFLAGNFARSLENPRTVARFALNIERFDLPEDHYQTYLARLEAVTTEDIQRVAKNMIQPNNLNICVVGSSDILDKLKRFDGGNGIDQYNAFGEKITPRSPAPAGTTVKGVLKAHFDAIGGAKNWGKVRGMQSFGSVEFGAGMTLQRIENKRLEKGNLAIKTTLDMAGQLVMARVVKPGMGEERQMGQVVEMSEEEVTQALEMLPPTRLLSLEKNGHNASVLGIEEIDGNACVLLEFSKNGKVERYWFSSQEGTMVQSERPTADGTVVIERLGQYVPFGEAGLSLPTVRSSTVGNQTMTERLARVTFNPEWVADDFKLQP